MYYLFTYVRNTYIYYIYYMNVYYMNVYYMNVYITYIHYIHIHVTDFRLMEAMANGALIFVDHMYTPRPHPLIDNKHVVYYGTYVYIRVCMYVCILYSICKEHPCGHNYVLLYNKTCCVQLDTYTVQIFYTCICFTSLIYVYHTTTYMYVTIPTLCLYRISFMYIRTSYIYSRVKHMRIFTLYIYAYYVSVSV